MNTSIWNTRGRIYELLELRRELTGEVAFTEMQVAARLTAIEECDKAIREYVVEEIKTNPQSIHSWMLESKARQHALEKEMQRIDGLLAIEQGEYSRAEELVMETLHAIGEKKLPVMGTLRRQANGGVSAVEISQPELVPPELQRVTVDMSLFFWNAVQVYLTPSESCKVSERRPDLTTIRKALEEGIGVPGCRLAERGEHLRCS